MAPPVSGKSILVTGGCGFIGSHLVERLSQENSVTVVDDLSSGRAAFIRPFVERGNVEMVRCSTASPRMAGRLAGKRFDAAFHLAANPDVRRGVVEPAADTKANILSTIGLLEYARKAGIPELLFASTSTVYGEPAVMPTPEDYGPLLPLSPYGAAKLACEGLFSAYAGTFGLRATLFRFANIIGPRGTHGVIYDFIHKLKRDPARLEILGDGTQRKSYLHVSDCIAGMLEGWAAHSARKDRVEVFNLGSEDDLPVERIADLVIGAMGLKGVNKVLTGGVDGGRGWKGDVKVMRLSVKKLRAAGWRPELGSEGAVKRAAAELVREMAGPGG